MFTCVISSDGLGQMPRLITEWPVTDDDIAVTVMCNYLAIDPSDRPATMMV